MMSSWWHCWRLIRICIYACIINSTILKLSTMINNIIIIAVIFPSCNRSNNTHTCISKFANILASLFNLKGWWPFIFFLMKPMHIYDWWVSYLLSMLFFCIRIPSCKEIINQFSILWLPLLFKSCFWLYLITLVGHISLLFHIFLYLFVTIQNPTIHLNSNFIVVFRNARGIISQFFLELIDFRLQVA